jgi:hypothetical protein
MPSTVWGGRRRRESGGNPGVAGVKWMRLPKAYDPPVKASKLIKIKREDSRDFVFIGFLLKG